ncbi:hypothetical protein BDK51DRAFT_48382 [Blyttiomyces helicus]|uniref:VWFA domain-containing protein n=1 Tax=Blyttiomyces helicus TaxID=388810 RepID=A0A4P9W1N7_9FUNG|nr:hypothetical protein BDK51DRAFT_48382 [Blyttiomyces helicus]|eukprot:RKO85073.1 hypothetical protein BDK51DRAFT_48382 [Blyttiomyces helicus]
MSGRSGHSFSTPRSPTRPNVWSRLVATKRSTPPSKPTTERPSDRSPASMRMAKNKAVIVRWLLLLIISMMCTGAEATTVTSSTRTTTSTTVTTSTTTRSTTTTTSAVTPTPTCVTAADILFLLDGSSNMYGYVSKIAAGFHTFAQNLQNSGLSARFAVAVFGGERMINRGLGRACRGEEDVLTAAPTPTPPSLHIHTIKSDLVITNATLYKVVNDSTYNVRQDNEPGLEAIRIALNSANNGADFENSTCFALGYNNSATGCTLVWGSSSTTSKTIIMMTDEDSDMPALPAYRYGDQSNNTALCAQENSNTYLNASLERASSFNCTNSNWFEANWTAVDMIYVSDYFNVSVGKTDPTGTYRQYVRNSSAAMWLDAAYYAEISATANLLWTNNVQMHLIMRGYEFPWTGRPMTSYGFGSRWWWSSRKSGADGNMTDWTKGDFDRYYTWTGSLQYGQPEWQSMSQDLTGFDSAKTQANLATANLSLSLQAQILQSGGSMRVYELENLLDSSEFFGQWSSNVSWGGGTTTPTVVGTAYATQIYNQVNHDYDHYDHDDLHDDDHDYYEHLNDDHCYDHDHLDLHLDLNNYHHHPYHHYHNLHQNDEYHPLDNHHDYYNDHVHHDLSCHNPLFCRHSLPAGRQLQYVRLCPPDRSRVQYLRAEPAE